jgi:hypothetical protein
MSKISKCPCCGGHAVMSRHDTIFTGQFYERYPAPTSTQNHGFQIRCEKCGMQTCYRPFENEALAAWNARSIELDAETISHLITDEFVMSALQTEWNEWVEDTGCIPDDFKIAGDDEVLIEFKASTWAEKVAEYLRILCFYKLHQSPSEPPKEPQKDQS